MSALAPLLLLLAAAAINALEPPPSPRAALLLLRAACNPQLHHLFDEARLTRSESVCTLLANRSLQILSYKETCGIGWEISVTRASLAALSGGMAVLSAGWPGSNACDALVASARALQRPQPGACVTSSARGAAVLQLARRLHWHRVLLPPSIARSECAAAIRHVAYALSLAGLEVRRAELLPHELARQPHVVILCASRRGQRVDVSGARFGEAGTGPPLLLLHVEEPERAPAASSSVVNHEINDAFRLSNISIVVSESLYYRNKKQNDSSSDAATAGEKARNLTSDYRRRAARSIVTSTYRIKNDPKIDSLRLRSENNERSGAVNLLDVRRGSARRFNRYKYDNKVVLKHEHKRRLTRDVRPVYQIDFIDHFLSRDQIPFFLCKLILTEENLSTLSVINENDVLENIIEAIRSDSETEHSRIEHSNTDFLLYEWTNTTSEAWRRVAILTITSNRSLDSAEEWTHVVGWSNVTVALDSWSVTGSREIEESGGAAALSAMAACSALLLAGGAALLGRWAAKRQRRRRQCEDAVLLPVDFTFPVDDRRRLGEGMETMLSCWLQQLHEFGGPELERPDLLKQPPLSTPRAPSAPSSTCSVNRVAVDRRIRYKGEVVHVKYLGGVGGPGAAGGVGTLELKRKATDVLLLMQNLRHENLNPFIGCLCEAQGALVFDACTRGSLEDVLMADEIKLDWTFRLSLLTDLVKGMRYLHSSALRVHGRLSSRNCVVDSRWVLRVTDYGVPAFCHEQALPQPRRTSRDLLWTAPELLRESHGEGRGSQPGDVFSFAIIMQEVIVRGEPYCMLSLTPDEIVEKVSHPPPLIRPSVSMGAAPPEAVSVMRQCWSEAPDQRPDFHRLHDIFRHLHRGRKINIVDSMFEMLEKYSNNLEELIRERTEQLDMEKKKTEQLLNRMLPRSVAERLVLGSRVEPEEFEEVSIYFSDIVGFTALAARSTPVQVVDLLNDLYSTFDAAIEQYRVYKVETIGDAYMVVGGLPVRSRDHATSVATMALHLLHLAGRFRVRHLPDTSLHLRIGLHTGPCCAAVVGLTMPRYCLFGDTVNTASRMESTGAAWRIQISAATAERLDAAGGYRLRSRGLIQIKGKGVMHTYWLLGKDGFDKPLPTPPPLESEEVLFETDGENENEPGSTSMSMPMGDSIRADPQGSDPSIPLDKHEWQVSGALSADSSPPRGARPAYSHTTHSVDHSANYSRYRCLGNVRRPIRRQWSLERGDTVVAASTAGTGCTASAPPSPPEPLALVASGVPPPRNATRYRTRPDRDPPNIDYPT